MKSKSNLFSAAAFLALCAPLAQGGTVSTTFSFQKGNLLQDGIAYGSGTGYSGVVDGRITDNSATSALSATATATLGNQFQTGSPNGQQHCGLFSYDLTELNNFITANTGTYSSVTIQSVSFTLVSSSVGSGSTMTLGLYGTDPFTASGCTWSNYTTGTAWTNPYQSIGSTAAYGHTGGPSALTSGLGGTSPATGTSATPIGTALTWTSSTNFISAANSALARADKTLYLTARGTFFNNGDSRVNVNTGTAANAADRPKLNVTLLVTTTAAPATWTGASSNSWTTAANWSPSGVPATDAPIIFNSSSTANLSTVLNQNFTVTSVSVASPSGAVSISGANSLNLGAGGFDLSAATQNLTVSAPVALGAIQSWNVGSGRTLGVNGAVSGNFPLTIAGAGKVALGASSILPSGASAGNLAVSGTLDLNGFSQSVNALTGSGTIDNTAGSATLTLGNNDATGTFSGTIHNTGGTLAMIKTGTGTLNLGNANTFSGGVTLNGGLINSVGAAGANTAFGSGTVTANSGTLYMTNDSWNFANALTLNGGNLRQGGGNNRLLTWSGPVSVTANSSILSDGGTAGVTVSGNVVLSSSAILGSTAGGSGHTISGSISGNGGVTVNSGTLVLNGAGSYTGSTLISAGALRLDPNGTIPAGGSLTINGAGSFNVRNTSGWVYNGTITGDGTGSISLSNATTATLAGPISGVAGITANSAGTAATVSGAVTGATTTVTVTGGAILTLSGNNSAMAGNVTFSGGTSSKLNIGNANALGTGTLVFGGATNTIDNSSGAALALATNNAQTWNNDLIFTGTRSLDMGNGPVTLGGNRTIFAQNNTLTVGGAISGADFGIIKGSAGGTLVLTGSSSYSGGTAISGGTLSINSIANYGVNSAIGAPLSGSIQLGAASNFCNLSYTGPSASTDRTVQLGDATPANAGVGAIQNNGTGALTFAAANFNPTIAGITATRTLWLGGTYTSGTNEIQGIIQDNDVAGKIAVGKSNDASTWQLSGANTYTGGTIVQGGTLKLGAAGSISTSSALTINAGATLDTSAKATYTLPGTQPLALGIDATGSGSSGKIAAASLNVSSAVVTYNITGTPDDPVYVLATYTSLSGTFASVPTPPTGYTLDYAYQGNKIALVQGTGSSYEAWKIANSTAQTINLDHDSDGVSNGVEYFLFGNANTTGFTALPGMTNNAGTRSVTWTKAAGYTGTYGTDFVVETSSTLVGAWASETLGVNVTITGNDVKYTFPSGSKNFARLKVTGP